MLHSGEARRTNTTRTGWVTMFVTLVVIGLTVVASAPAHAQTYRVLHNFTGGTDGANPEAGLAIDAAGNLYGTTSGGGAGFGTAFKLTRSHSNFLFNPLYTFQGSDENDGASPAAITIGPNGSLYGPTMGGGNPQCSFGCGTVFNLQPPPRACTSALCPWSETVLYRFSGGMDGSSPGLGGVIFDHAGNLYGTTSAGGANNAGVIYELVASTGWMRTLLYTFTGGTDGGSSFGGLVFDNAGRLYGTTAFGGAVGCGEVFQLTGSTLKVIYSFQCGDDGENPIGGVVIDSAGNLYGTTSSGGTGGGGTAFQLTPSGSNWTFSLIYSFSGAEGPHNNLIRDTAGNLYGTAFGGAFGAGLVFKLTPSGGTWSFTDLYDFTGGTDGSDPLCAMAIDSSGNLYGTTFFGGSDDQGVVFEIAP